MLKTLSAFIPTLIDVAAFASPLRVIYMQHTSVQEGGVYFSGALSITAAMWKDNSAKIYLKPWSGIDSKSSSAALRSESLRRCSLMTTVQDSMNAFALILSSSR